MKKNEKIIILISGILFIIILFCLFICNGCDKDFHVARLIGLANEIKTQGLVNYPYYINSSQFYGYGYATPIFYGDFHLIVPAMLINFRNKCKCCL